MIGYWALQVGHQSGIEIEDQRHDQPLDGTAIKGGKVGEPHAPFRRLSSNYCKIEPAAYWISRPASLLTPERTLPSPSASISDMAADSGGGQGRRCDQRGNAGQQLVTRER